MMIPISATNHLVWHGPITYWQSITQTTPNACCQSDMNISKYYTKLSSLIYHDMQSLISIQYTKIVLVPKNGFRNPKPYFLVLACD